MSIEKSHSEIGERIKLVRTRADLNQKEFAQSLGVKQSWISELEAGKKPPTDLLLIAIEYRYKISPDWMKSGREPMFIEQSGQTGRSPTKANSDEAVPEFKISDALAMAARVLESGTSYATALYLNIQHFDRAIQAESRIVHLERNMKTLEDRFMAMEEELRKLRQAQKDRDEELLEKKAV